MFTLHSCESANWIQVVVYLHTPHIAAVPFYFCNYSSHKSSTTSARLTLHCGGSSCWIHSGGCTLIRWWYLHTWRISAAPSYNMHHASSTGLASHYCARACGGPTVVTVTALSHATHDYSSSTVSCVIMALRRDTALLPHAVFAMVLDSCLTHRFGGAKRCFGLCIQQVPIRTLTVSRDSGGLSVYPHS